MEILAVDIGTGTQDILVFNSELDPENSYKLVVPSPTMIFHRRIRNATYQQRPVLLTGMLMGGGPVTWAAKAHISAGLTLLATPQAARTFDDDLDYVQREMGVILVSDDEAAALPDAVIRLDLKDFDFEQVMTALAQWGYLLAPDMIAVAVFDHGDAPPGYSDRLFRFDYLKRRILHTGRLSAFAYREDDIPPAMTRLRAVARSAAPFGVPVVVMDTAPAAILGATLDPVVAKREHALIANIGNFHTLVFRLGLSGIEGLFEHHTGELTHERLDDLIAALADGTLTHDHVYDDQGHGAAVFVTEPMEMAEDKWNIAVTGPRRNLALESRHYPYFAVPYGDMMMAGCFGMLRAIPDLDQDLGRPILDCLTGKAGRAPWDIA